MLDFLIPIKESDLAAQHAASLIVQPLGNGLYAVAKNRWGKVGLHVDESWLKVCHAEKRVVHVLVQGRP